MCCYYYAIFFIKSLQILENSLLVYLTKFFYLQNSKQKKDCRSYQQKRNYIYTFTNSNSSFILKRPFSSYCYCLVYYLPLVIYNLVIWYFYLFFIIAFLFRKTKIVFISLTNVFPNVVCKLFVILPRRLRTNDKIELTRSRTSCKI